MIAHCDPALVDRLSAVAQAVLVGGLTLPPLVALAIVGRALWETRPGRRNQ